MSGNWGVIMRSADPFRKGPSRSVQICPDSSRSIHIHLPRSLQIHSGEVPPDLYRSLERSLQIPPEILPDPFKNPSRSRYIQATPDDWHRKTRPTQYYTSMLPTNPAQCSQHKTPVACATVTLAPTNAVSARLPSNATDRSRQMRPT